MCKIRFRHFHSTFLVFLLFLFSVQRKYFTYAVFCAISLVLSANCSVYKYLWWTILITSFTSQHSRKPAPLCNRITCNSFAPFTVHTDYLEWTLFESLFYVRLKGNFSFVFIYLFIYFLGLYASSICFGFWTQGISFLV